MSLLLALLLAAQTGEKSNQTGWNVFLWADGAPGARGEEEADKPSLTVHAAPAETAVGAGVVVCPGGGYGFLAVDHEGRQIAAWLNRHGIHAFVLRYRIAKRYRHPAPMDDVQRAIRTVRARAKEWNVDPERIGVMGFSAGGHLASTAAVHFDGGDPDAADPIDRAGCRPDFAILVYPVITMTDEKHTHKGSRRNLLGDRVDDATLRRKMSSELQVTAKTPPTFLLHTTEDRVVTAENALMFHAALRKSGVPSELHVYEKGRHGFGLADKGHGPAGWPDRCLAWMRARGLLEKR